MGFGVSRFGFRVLEVRGFGVFEVRGFGFGVLEVRGFLFGFSRFQVPGLRGSGFRVRGFSRFLGSTFQGCRFVFWRFGVSGSGFEVRGFGFGVSRFGLLEVRGFTVRASGGSRFLRFGVWCSWFRVRGFAVRACGGSRFLRFGVLGSCFRVRGFAVQAFRGSRF